MHLNTVSYSDIQGLQVHDQMFTYAEAYRNAAAIHCQHMIKDAASCTWPNASAVLMLTAHAVELFLKGAILKRSPNANVWDHQHSIDDLVAAYKAQFPESSFEWDIPFKGGDGYPDTFTVEQIKKIEELKKKIRCPSILYRYPVDKEGKEWRAMLGFEPRGFLSLLEQVETDFERIRSQLK